VIILGKNQAKEREQAYRLIDLFYLIWKMKLKTRFVQTKQDLTYGNLNEENHWTNETFKLGIYCHFSLFPK